MRTKIDIDTRTFVRFWLVVFGIGLAAWLAYKAMSGFIILGVSFFLALALNTPVSRISKKLPGKSRVGATALAYVAVIAFLGVIITLVIPPVIQQTARFAQNAPEIVQNATEQWTVLSNFVERNNLQPQLDSALNSIQKTATEWAGNFGQNIVSGIGSVFSFFTALILVLVLTFLMLIEGPKLMDEFWHLYPNRKTMAIHRRVANKMYNVVSGYVTGQLTVSAIGATFAGLFVFILNIFIPEIPASLAMPTAAVTFVLSLIPMFGATIGGTIITLLLALNDIPGAIIYAIYFIIYQQVENNFISPHIQAKHIDLSALMVLGSATVGLYMFGVIGGIIAIPIAGSVRVIIDEYLDYRRLENEKDTSNNNDDKSNHNHGNKKVAPNAKLIAKK